MDQRVQSKLFLVNDRKKTCRNSLCNFSSWEMGIQMEAFFGRIWHVVIWSITECRNQEIFSNGEEIF